MRTPVHAGLTRTIVVPQLSAMSLCITRTIVELDGEGYLQFNVAERPVPLESSLQDDQVLIALEACPVVSQNE